MTNPRMTRKAAHLCFHPLPIHGISQCAGHKLGVLKEFPGAPKRSGVMKIV